MPNERLAPDELLVQTNLSGAVTDIDDDPDDPDLLWLLAGQNVTTTCRVSFPTPSANPSTGAGVQEFRVLLRKTAINNSKIDDTYTVFLYENGSQVGSSIANGSNVPTGGVVVSAIWDASSLGTANGSLVECHVVGTPEGSGAASTRGSIEVGAVEWNAEVPAPATNAPAGHAAVSVAANAATVDAVGEVRAGHSAVSVVAGQPQAAVGVRAPVIG